MLSKQIEIGAVYRHRTSSVGYAQAVQILPPKTVENTTARVLVKCAWASSPEFDIFMYKYFKPCDLIRHTSKIISAIEAAPPKRKWVGLTDDERNAIEAVTLGLHGIPSFFATAIEAKLKELNHG